MKVKYNTGGKSPVDPPRTSPESRSTYKIGNMHFMGEEADRLIAFDEYLVKEFPDLDLFQRAEQVEKFLNAKAHKSNDAMDAYSVDPSLKEVKAPSLMDTFGSEFGSSPFGGSDPFEDDPDIQRMREEAAARDKKKGKRKRFEQGGKLNNMKVKYGKGGSAKEMYASGGMLKALLKDPKQAEMAREILAEMGAKIPKYEEGGETDPPQDGGMLSEAVVTAKKGGITKVPVLEKSGDELVNMLTEAVESRFMGKTMNNLNDPSMREDYNKFKQILGKGDNIKNVMSAISFLDDSSVGSELVKGNPSFFSDLKQNSFKTRYAIPVPGEKGFRYLTDEEAAEYEGRKGEKNYNN